MVMMDLPNSIKKNKLKLLGEGAQGKVYRIDGSRCIKIFKRPQCLQRELDNLRMAAHEPCFPKVYEWGKDYIIREYMEGIELGQYLQKSPLTKSISWQLVELLRAFERLHFRRIDTQLKNVIITSKGKLRPIDFVNSMSKKQLYPKLLLGQLKKINMKKTFLEHVKLIDKALFNKWNAASK
jgi:predicted Ser/Thr protein kinase